LSSRPVLAGAGALALAAAVGLSAVVPSPRGSGSTAALGGLSTLLVDVWFLRAEALRREGRVDELPALYRRILEAAPDSETAIDYLADVEANDLLSLAPTTAAKVAWWDEADALLARALEQRPGSARLLFRRAQIRLGPGTDVADVANALKSRGADVRLDAFRFLADAVERAPSLGRAGRAHLVAFARVVPELVAERYVNRRPGADELLARSELLLRLRGDDFDDFTLGDASDAASAGARLYGALGVVHAVRELLARTPPDRDGARRVVAAYASSPVAVTSVADALGPFVQRP